MLNQDQWYRKLKGLVQSWIVREPNSIAIFKAHAKVLALQGQVLQDHLDETFIDKSSDDYAAMHGEERSVERLPGENLSSYKERIKIITNKSNLPALKKLIDAQLIRGECTIIEYFDASNFLDRGAFLDRNIIGFQVEYNSFIILIDFQVPMATSFYNRESFLDREFLNGSSISSESVFRNIVDVVNKNKVYGTVYRLIERAN